MLMIIMIVDEIHDNNITPMTVNNPNMIKMIHCHLTYQAPPIVVY